MGRIDRSKAGSQEAIRPKLTADMIPTNTVVLTVEKARQIPHRSGVGSFFEIVFGEYPDHAYLTNATQEDALLALVDGGIMSDDLDDWVGEKIAFFKRENKNPESGEIVTKLYAATPDEFVEALKSWGKAKGGKAVVRWTPQNDLGASRSRAKKKGAKKK